MAKWFSVTLTAETPRCESLRPPSGLRTRSPPLLSAAICQVAPDGIAPSGAPLPSSVTNSSPSPPRTTWETPANSPTRSSGSAPGVSGEGAGRGQALPRSARLASAGVAQRGIQLLERPVNVGIRVGAGDEGGLESGGGEKHAARGGSAVPTPEQGRVGRLRLGVIADRTWREEHPPHRARVSDAGGHPVPPRGVPYTRDQPG